MDKIEHRIQGGGGGARQNRADLATLERALEIIGQRLATANENGHSYDAGRLETAEKALGKEINRTVGEIRTAEGHGIGGALFMAGPDEYFYGLDTRLNKKHALSYHSFSLLIIWVCRCQRG
jgi:hypothetical protein